MNKTTPSASPDSIRQQTKRKYRHGDWRPDAVAAAGEFVGTFIFLLLGLGGIQASAIAAHDGSPGGIVFAALAMGSALTFTIWSFFLVSGSAFNPCVALTLVLLGALRPRRFVLYCLAHFVGAIAACAVLAGILPGPLTIACRLGNGTTVLQGFFIEMLLTCFLCFTVVMSAVEKNKATHICALAIGTALFSTQLMAMSFTGSSVNSARAFGAAAIVGFDSYHWIYWIGPGLGAVLAAAMYRLLLLVHFWEVQPHEDEVPVSQTVRSALHDLSHDHAAKTSPPVNVESV